jgi:hypothetical protein
MTLLGDLESRICPHCLDRLAVTRCDECSGPSCAECLVARACPRCTTCPICYAEVNEDFKPCCGPKHLATMNAEKRYDQEIQAYKDRP